MNSTLQAFLVNNPLFYQTDVSLPVTAVWGRALRECETSLKDIAD